MYPHKTGGYIQPMSVEQSDNLKRLDRRSVGGERKAKGIVSDKSWDRWLEEYLKPKEDKPKFTPKPTPLPIYIPIGKPCKRLSTSMKVEVTKQRIHLPNRYTLTTRFL